MSLEDDKTPVFDEQPSSGTFSLNRQIGLWNSDAAPHPENYGGQTPHFPPDGRPELSEEKLCPFPKRWSAMLSRAGGIAAKWTSDSDQRDRGSLTRSQQAHFARDSRMTHGPESTTPGLAQRTLTALGMGLVFLAIYFAAGKFGLSLAFFNASASPIWPPTGLALAVVLLWGYRFGFAIFAGAFLVNITTQGSVATSLAIGCGNSLEALLGAWLVGRFVDRRNIFDKPAGIFQFAVLAAVLSTTISPLFGVTSLCLGGFTPWNQYGASWLTWWLGDLVSDLTVAPLVLIWALEGLPRLTRAQLLEAGAIALTLVLVDGLVFVGPSVLVEAKLPTDYLALLPLVWAAFRFGKRGAITGAIFTSAMVLLGALRGRGPFAKADLNESLLLSQAFVATFTLTALLVAAIVSQQRATEEALRAELAERKQSEQDRARLSSIVQSSEDAILSKDLAGKIITWNRAAERIFGYRAEEIVGQDIYRIVPPEFREREDQLLERLRRGESISHYETIRTGKNGERIPVSLSLSPMRDSGGRVLGSCSIARDITQRKQTEQALEKANAELEAHARTLEKTVAERTAQLSENNAELEAFSYSLSHDLRAPLRAIRGFATAVLEDRREALGEDAAHLERVINSAHRMDRLIQDVLAFSRVSRRNLVPQKVDVQNLILTLTNERLDLQPPRAEIQIANPLPLIRGDEASLSQCLANLLDNAVKFVPPDVVPRVIIRSESGKGLVRLWFEDNGIGIEPGLQPTIFEMFRRAHPGGQYEGSGLGLAIVRKAVERMGGAVGVQSQVGQGSRFWLELPAA